MNFFDTLFQPSFIGKEANGFYDNTMKCDDEFRENFYVHVMLPGGTTMFQWIFFST